ncbi:g7214 [Coccomyxa viridis]|uniref:G7214 protein n=1 Tax=Coccomyxa viridis TaxID=1274662 RepID=A0ABP1G3W1_9CHLO
MGISMGEGGLRVLDVHNRKRLLAVYADKRCRNGERWYIGGIDCVAVPSDVPEQNAAKHIRVGFVHHHKDKQDSRAATQCSQGGPPTSAEKHRGSRMIMTLLAAMAMNDAPLDLLDTDGTNFALYRLRDRELLMY